MLCELLTREEALQAGLQYEMHPVVKDFISTKFNRSKSASRNDMLEHHKIARKFCIHLKKHNRPCSWEEYYLVLDQLRDPFKTLYDPGMDPRGESLAAIQSSGRSGADYQSSCDILTNPSSKTLFEYVINNKPAIIRGAMKDWPALRLWTDDYLIRKLRGRQV